MNVLLGIGGTDDSFQALHETVERAAATGDEVTVAVLDNPASDRTQESVAEEVRERLADSEIDAELRLVDGDPGSQLVEIGEREGFDQIVLGGGQRSPMGKIDLGHVSEFVLLNATTSVKLVR